MDNVQKHNICIHSLNNSRERITLEKLTVTKLANKLTALRRKAGSFLCSQDFIKGNLTEVYIS
jgi:hypothetical protein